MSRKRFMFFLVAMFIGIGTVFAQKKVSGVVVDNAGEPFIGASILVKGTSRVDATNTEGRFTITVDNDNSILIVRCIGYKTVEVPAKNAARVVLYEDETQLDEVMVVAYGTTKKASFTGSASTVSAEKLAASKVESVDKSLAGKVAGVRVASVTGNPGAAGDIQVRGIGSINGSTSPLYVVDGVPVVSGNYGGEPVNSGAATGGRASSSILSTINPEDIESITVLKDAAASSLYGSRAANGVVIITTKKGKKGKTKFNLSSSMGWSEMATKSFQPMNASEYLAYQKAALEGYYLNQNKAFLPTQANYGNQDIQAKAKEFAEANYLNEDYSIITDASKQGEDWRKLIYDGGKQSDIQLSASGGNETTSFFTSLGYNKVDGLVRNSSYERYSSLVNLNNKANNWLDLNLKTQLAYSLQKGYADQSEQEQGLGTSSPLSLLFSSNPAEKAYNADGSINTSANFNSSVKNALLVLSDDDQYLSNKTVRVMTNLGAKAQITPELSFNTNNSLDYFTVKTFNYWGPYSVNGEPMNGLGEVSKSEVTTLTSSNTLNYNKTFARIHNLAAIAGVEVQNNKQDYLFLAAKDYSNDVLKDLANGQASSATTKTFEHLMASYFGSVNYNYDNKYYVSGSLRQDKSSKLGKAKRVGTFYSLSGAWRFSADLLKDNPVLTNGMVKLSYGTNGNLPMGNYSYLGLYYFGGSYADTPASYLYQSNNANLGWESSKSLNVGVETSLWNRVNVGVEFYRKYTSNLLLEVPTSYYTANSVMTKNSGAISNTGWEFEVHADDILRSEKVVWNADFSLSTLKAVVEQLPNGDDIMLGDGSLYLYREKEDLYSFYMPTFVRVDPKSGVSQFLIDPTKPVADDNLTYEYSKAGYGKQASAYPKVMGAFTNSLSFKRFTLDMLLTYQYGGHLFDYPNYFFTNAGLRNYSLNYSKDMVGKYWVAEGDNAEYQRPILSDPYRSDKWSSRHIKSTDFIRLKQLSLSYAVPEKVYKKAGLSKLDLTFSVNNVAYLYAATKNMELETALNGYRTTDTPLARTYLFGINIGF